MKQHYAIFLYTFINIIEYIKNNIRNINITVCLKTGQKKSHKLRT